MTNPLHQTATPKGVVGVFTDKEGRVIASVSDFDMSGYGGFSLLEAQKLRVRKDLSREVIRKYCSWAITEAIEPYDCEQIVRRLVEKGARVTVIPVGHEGAEND